MSNGLLELFVAIGVLAILRGLLAVAAPRLERLWTVFAYAAVLVLVYLVLRAAGRAGAV